ncbi:MAG: methylenetetrahydrofolate reductase C-terminal domain-containing protein [Acidobacteriia bacterium]|nr:methylenetetrahydrofolate reductase C-terminal domain-containing protein [Terriglobia bacterium]
MALGNSIREGLASGKFCYMVELVASGLTREAKLLQVASELAQVPGLVGAGITSYAGGAMGHDPIRVATAARARGLTPNVHITCVGKDRLTIRRELDDLNALGIENVFAITGDYPKGVDHLTNPTPYDLDSVQLVEFLSELRAAGMPFQISVAVSPFKFIEPDCVYQYLKLEKKIKAGADFVITQLGYDSRKFRELKRYLDERGIKTPVFGNVYVLAAKPAERMSKGDPPGCWVAPELVARIQEETKQSTDKGLAGRLERAARMVAIVRGLGYAGAYLGGDHQASRVRWIIKRSEEIAHRWEEFAQEISYAPKNAYYIYDSPPSPPQKRSLWVNLADIAEPANWPGPLRRALTVLFRWIDKRPALSQALERAELAFKEPVFGCQACGNCVLGFMEYVCPMTCPKNLRNGPCGGPLNGMCEVLPDRPCIWVQVYERAKAANRIGDLSEYIPPRNRALKGTSSYLNYLLKRDSRPGNTEPLINITAAPHPAAVPPRSRPSNTKSIPTSPS